MKSYQDPDPLHGNGKAHPKPKRPITLALLALAAAFLMASIPK